ncbi:MAG: aspartate-semialdehyde dehydrogenase [Bacillota bacterium]|nr:aspartate-semialdehyde dehydrogenase [Bacillota bacterium]
MKTYNVAVVGATGMVGQKMIEVLVERKFPYNNLKLLASSRSADQNVTVDGKSYKVEELSKGSLDGVDFAFFSAGESISKEHSPEAAKAGTIIIDNSNAFRMEKDVPLVVPEVNPQAVFSHKGIIANPNCSTIQMVVALEPLHRKATLKRVVASTYQAVSGAGKEAVEELFEQSRAHLAGEAVNAEYIPHKGALRSYQLAFNCVPQIDIFVDNGYCKEETKMINETRKIMNLPDLAITTTTVRIPVVTGHSIALNVEFEEPISPDEAKVLLKETPGVAVLDNPEQLEYPTPLAAADYDDVYVGRIRQDFSVKNGLNLWVVSDNIRKGAATNSIQIAELLISG